MITVSNEQTTPTLEQTIRETSQRYLLEIINTCGGNISEAARHAGVSRKHMYRLIGEYNIQTAPRINRGNEMWRSLAPGGKR